MKNQSTGHNGSVMLQKFHSVSTVIITGQNSLIMISVLIGQLFTHEFDSVNQLLRIGIPKSVVSSGGIYYWKDNRDMPDVLNCVFEYPDRDLTLLYSATLC